MKRSLEDQKIWKRPTGTSFRRQTRGSYDSWGLWQGSTLKIKRFDWVDSDGEVPGREVYYGKEVMNVIELPETAEQLSLMLHTRPCGEALREREEQLRKYEAELKVFAQEMFANAQRDAVTLPYRGKVVPFRIPDSGPDIEDVDHPAPFVRVDFGSDPSLFTKLHSKLQRLYRIARVFLKRHYL